MKIVVLSLFILTASVCAVPQPKVLVIRKRIRQPPKRTSCLAEHNFARRRVDVPPLKWSRALERTAQKYASMIRNGRFQHSCGLFLKTGENLYRTSKPLARTTWKGMHRLWLIEKKWFRNRVFPDVSTTGGWKKVGYYTAMMWRTTTHFVCAAAQGNKGTTFVCHYKKQGNIFGRRTY